MTKLFPNNSLVWIIRDHRKRHKPALTLPELRSPVESFFVARAARKYEPAPRSDGMVLRPRPGLRKSTESNKTLGHKTTCDRGFSIGFRENR